MMSTEITILILAALLQVLQFALMAIPANLELGPRRTLSPRDETPLAQQTSRRTARLIRAMDNHFEALILFTIACVTLAISNKSTLFTEICAWIYLAARIIYIPAYAFGWVPWRSIIWFIGFIATTLMLIAVLF